MKRRIIKKILKRDGCRTHKEFHEATRLWLEHIESLKEPKTEEEIAEEKFWDEFWGCVLGG